MKLLAASISTPVKVPIQLPTHTSASAEKEEETNGRHEHTRDVGVTAFSIQAFCANSCRH